jgi:hypothetical protein
MERRQRVLMTDSNRMNGLLTSWYKSHSDTHTTAHLVMATDFPVMGEETFGEDVRVRRREGGRVGAVIPLRVGRGIRVLEWCSSMGCGDVDRRCCSGDCSYGLGCGLIARLWRRGRHTMPREVWLLLDLFERVRGASWVG